MINCSHSSIPIDRSWNLILDRGIYSSKIFTDVLYSRNLISDLSLYLLDTKLEKSIAKFFGKSKPYGSDCILFVNTPIELCHKYITQRNHSEESIQQLDYDLSTYQNMLQKRYFQYLDDFSIASGSYNNVSCSFVTDMEKITHQCVDFIKRSLI